MTIARFILSGAVWLFAVFIAVMNWGAVIVSMRNKRRGIAKGYSTVPLFSGFLAVVALVLNPRADKMLWMLAVPLLDIANWGLLLFPMIVIGQFKGKKEER